MSNREKAHNAEDAEALLLRYQVVQRSMEKNSANLTDEWYIDKQMTTKLEHFDQLPYEEMNSVRKLWSDCLGPSRTKMQALSVLIDPRIWEMELKGIIKLEEKLIQRAEIAYDALVNKVVDEDKRASVNKTWFALRSARKARLQASDTVDNFSNNFNNNFKIARANIIGPWKWWSNYAGAANAEFTMSIARRVLNIRCNASATERVNSMYKHVIGLRRCRMRHDRAEKLVYTYVNSRIMKRVRETRRDQATAEVKELPIYALPKLIFDETN